MDRPAQPGRVDSALRHVRVSRSGGVNLTIELLPMGIWRSHKSLILLLVGVVGLTVVVSVTNPLILPLLQGRMPRIAAANVIQFIITSSMYSLLIVFVIFLHGAWLFAIGLALNWGAERATIDVVDRGIIVTRKSLFATRVWRWNLESIDRIWVGPSGVEINGVSIVNLRVKGTPSVGKANRNGEVGLFTSRSDEELKWVAAELSAVLQPINPETQTVLA